MDKTIPLRRVFPAGKLSPVDVYERVRGENSFLLESVQQGQCAVKDTHWNNGRPTSRYSFIGFDPYLVFKSKGKELEIRENGKVYFEKANPIKRLKGLIDRFRLVKRDGLPPFSGGGVGYFSYEVRHFFEELPCLAFQDLDIPEIYVVFTDKVIAFDHYEGAFSIICSARPGGYNKTQAEDELHCIEREIFSQSYNVEDSPLFLSSRIESNFTKEEFMRMVERAKEYIKRGDIYQANLSQRLSIPIEGDAWVLYKILREINPSPFASFLDFEDVKIASSSPERLLFVKGDVVETRPIAGTRPRGENSSEDRKLSRKLLLSPKERAEHIMLVDLERNDLGRVCRYGTVEVNELMTLENYSHVIHIVSNVRGRLRQGMDRFSALASCFPGGTITGTPKIRSMEIIDELEKVARCVYTGSIGYLSYSGEMDLNIVIRTFVIVDGYAHIQVGAGIVADSDPEREYYETLYKAEALIAAVRRAKSKNGVLCHN